MKRNNKLLTLFFIACLAGFAHANDAAAEDIGFETYPNGSPVPGGAEITDDYASPLPPLLAGVTFDSICTEGATQVTYVMDNVTTSSSPNSLGPCGPAPYIGDTLILNFDPPVIEMSASIVDDEYPVVVSAYDAGDSLVDQTQSDGVRSTIDQITVSGSGIKRVEMVGGYKPLGNPDGWGIDDLVFSTESWGPAAVEASTFGVTDVSSSNRLNTFAALLLPLAAVVVWRGVRRRKR